MTRVLRQTRIRGVRHIALFVLLALSGCAGPSAISYPDGWVLTIHLPRATVAQIGIHSFTNVASQSLEEFSAKALAGWRRGLRPELEAVTLSRRSIRLANGVPASEVVHEIGTEHTTKSRKTFVLVRGTGVVIDAETYRTSWDALQPDFERIARSFTIE